MNYIEQALSDVDFSVGSSKSSTVYYNSKGVVVPRVTEILSKTIHNDGLMYWANSIGLHGQRYREVMNEAARIGSVAHAAIENFLKDKLEDESNIPFLGFMMWYKLVSQDMKLPIDVLYIEHKMSCEWFGGTLDCLAKIGDKIYLIDFKTSNHVTFTYFLQLAAYRYMLRVLENTEVAGVIVLQLDKLSPGFNEYLLDFQNPEHLGFINQCELTFLSMTYAYYQITKSERDFKIIFKG